MKALSLWQPWATAIAVSVNTIETRHWSTRYRGPLLIHAAKHRDPMQREFTESEQAIGRLPMIIPFGAIVAICELVDVRPTHALGRKVSATERLYGDYAPGRFGWLLDNVRAFDEPIPYRGRQALFDVPDEMVEQRVWAAR